MLQNADPAGSALAAAAADDPARDPGRLRRDRARATRASACLFAIAPAATPPPCSVFIAAEATESDPLRKKLSCLINTKDGNAKGRLIG